MKYFKDFGVGVPRLALTDNVNYFLTGKSSQSYLGETQVRRKEIRKLIEVLQILARYMLDQK